MRKLYTSLFLLLLCWATPRAFAQCNGCGTGAEGAFDATSNTTIAGGVHNFTTFHIASGVTVRVTGAQPLEIYATGAVNIEGTLDVSGLNGSDGVTYVNGGPGALGVAGGGNGGNGSFASGSGPFDGSAASGAGAGAFGAGWSGGGGAGYTAVGGSSGGVGGVGGPSYGLPDLTGNTPGSGGGGGSGGYDCGAGGGGAGGGFVSIIACTSLDISGTINANGGNGGSDGAGNCGGGGAGSGGSIWLASPTVTISGAVTANGGAGGASNISGSPYFGVGGTGSAGRVRIDGTATVSGSVSPASGFAGALPVVLAVNAVATDATCFGAGNGTATATATGSAGYQYLWNIGATTASISGLSPGCYNVIVIDSSGCTATDTVCLTAPTALVLNVTGVPNVVCHGDCDGAANVSVSGGTPSYGVAWSTGSTSISIINLCAGSYDVTITDANGCMDTASYVVTEPTAIALSTSVTSATSGTATDGSASVVASGGNATYTYLWTPGGATTATASNLTAGSYTVQVTDSVGCTATDTVVVGITVGVSTSSGLAFSLFPNPTQGLLTLSLNRIESSPLTLTVFDAQGKLVRQENLGSALNLRLPMDLSTLPAGVYHLRLSSDGGMATQRITLTR